MVNTNPTGHLNEFVKAFDIAAQVIIMASVNRGDKIITLDTLYHLTGADNKATKCSVRWAVRRAKDNGFIESSSVKGVYTVN